MPASRSRTLRWRDSLWRIYERGGGLEFAFAQDDDQPERGKDIVWRVRVLGLTDTEITIETPGALGQSFRVEPGAKLVGVMTVGQNRWMFHTDVLGMTEVATRSGAMPALRLQMPAKVERCMRRNFERISTAELQLPEVRCWPLRDPKTAIPAEVASRVRLLDANDADLTGPDPATDALMPDVGPPLQAQLANLGGGGVGLVLDHEQASLLEVGARLFWMRIDLSPRLPAPLCLTAKLAHTHIDSTQRVYAGMAFEFSHNPSHKRFVIDQIDRYLTGLQHQRRAA